MAAGVFVAGANALLLNSVLLRHLREVAAHAAVVVGAVRGATSPTGGGFLDAEALQVRDVPGDALRTVPLALNALVDAVAEGLQARGRLETELQHRATHDTLTGLADRGLLLDELTQRLARADPHIGVVYLDLDGFKGLNDAYGHAAGDEVLRTFAARLAACCAPGDVAARMGGDEFAVLVADGDPDGFRARLATVWSVPVLFGDLRLPVAGSVGTAVAVGGTTADALLHEADTSMYADKAARRRAALPRQRAEDSRARLDAR